jgi:hypothetical protein
MNPLIASLKTAATDFKRTWGTYGTAAFVLVEVSILAIITLIIQYTVTSGKVMFGFGDVPGVPVVFALAGIGAVGILLRVIQLSRTRA